MVVNTQLFDLINAHEHILIISHRRPDADTLGANCALFLYLQNIGKKVTAFCIDSIPEHVSFSPVLKQFTASIKQGELDTYDVIIVVDCGNISLTGIEKLLKNRRKEIALVNIDHHHDNARFGTLNIVDIDSSSTSEILYNLFYKAKIAITKDMTNCLLMGIMYDTNFFTNAATTIKSIQYAGELLRQGASIKKATNILWRNKSIDLLKLWGKIFERIQYNQEYGIAISIVTQQDLKDHNLDAFNHSDVSNYLQSLNDARLILLLIEQDDGTIRGSLRTTHDDIDVSLLAAKLGGGGHKKAAAFSLPGKIKTHENNSWKIV